VPQNLTKPVRIDELARRATFVHAKAIEQISRRSSVRIDKQLEQAVSMTPLHRHGAIPDHELATARRRLHRPDDDGRAAVVCGRMRSKDRERIVSGSSCDRIKHVVFYGSNAAGHGRNCTAWE